MKQKIDFTENTYQKLGKRIHEMGEQVIEILSLLFDRKEGLYHKEVLNNIKYSDVVVRPILNSLYSSGFVDREEKGTMKIYSINKNGKRLLKDIKGGKFDE